MRFIEGDVVRISRKSHWYGECPLNNPKDIEGVIFKHPMNSVWVRWEHNGNTNVYYENDLRLVRRF